MWSCGPIFHRCLPSDGFTWWQPDRTFAMAALSVSVSDFPTYDGAGSPEDFVRQCSRLATLGNLPDSQLGAIVAARCQGRALSVVNGIEEAGTELSLTTVTTQLRAHFGGATGSVEQATQSLATLSKGHLSAQSYGLKVKQLVRRACPEFFGEDGQVKKVCVPSYNAALYRHFLAGLSSEDRCLLSRQKATTFEQCLSEFTREEGLETAEVTSAVSSRRVRWDGVDGPGHDQAAHQWRPAVDSRGRSGSPGAGQRDSPTREQRWCDEPEEYGGYPERRSGFRERRSRWGSPGTDSTQPGPRRWTGNPSGGSPGRRHSTSPWGGTGRTWTRSSGGGAPTDGTGSGRGEAHRARARGRAPSPRAAGGRAARTPSPEADYGVEGRRSGIVRCWSCGGVGHMKRQCPNEFAGRRVMY